MDHQNWQRLVAHRSACPGCHGYSQSCWRKSHKTNQADRNGGCLMGEGRCWTCPTVHWTQRRAACRKNWRRSSHSRTVSWPSEHTPSQQPDPWCGREKKFTSLAFLRLCWRFCQPSVVSTLLTLDVLQHLCGVHHAAFCYTGSRRLISLMLFGS